VGLFSRVPRKSGYNIVPDWWFRSAMLWWKEIEVMSLNKEDVEVAS